MYCQAIDDVNSSDQLKNFDAEFILSNKHVTKSRGVECLKVITNNHFECLEYLEQNLCQSLEL